MSRRGNELIEVVRTVATQAGAIVEITPTGSQHTCAALTFNGQRRKMYLSGSPGALCAVHKVRCEARRTLRSMGAQI
jgi:hypothetical protein